MLENTWPFYFLRKRCLEGRGRPGDPGRLLALAARPFRQRSLNFSLFEWQEVSLADHFNSLFVARQSQLAISFVSSFREHGQWRHVQFAVKQTCPGVQVDVQRQIVNPDSISRVL
jgi:hypothetical protein